ncbi:hypothetical protein HDV00_001025 [Rhizophlyctis rosea]|nr:hypothetical protein HDV00_001025 [Rhizophlyctis rosea]
MSDEDLPDYPLFDADLSGAGIRYGIYLEAFAILTMYLVKYKGVEDEFKSCCVLLATLTTGLVVSMANGITWGDSSILGFIGEFNILGLATLPIMYATDHYKHRASRYMVIIVMTVYTVANIARLGIILDIGPSEYNQTVVVVNIILWSLVLCGLWILTFSRVIPLLNRAQRREHCQDPWHIENGLGNLFNSRMAEQDVTEAQLQLRFLRLARSESS